MSRPSLPARLEEVRKGEESGLTALLTRLLHGVGQLVSDHVTLARLEIGAEAQALGGGLGILALFGLLALTGHALVCGALAVLLGRWLTLPGALFVVGGANLVLGAVGLRLAVARLRRSGAKVETAGEAGP